MFTTLAVIGMIALAVVILCFRDRQAWRDRNRKYLKTQADRSVLMDDYFCRKAGLDPETAAIIGIIRTNLAEPGVCDASRIYPGDSLADFGLDYDDDVAMLVQKMGVIPGFTDYSFPLEDVNDVASFAKIILKMKQDAEPSL